jgi:hypothetical protein
MDLLHPHQRKALAAQISADIDEFCRVTYDDGHRRHLGASLIGHECARYLWYVFRWVEAAAFSGRMMRLFNRGHETEARFVYWLRGIGFEVWDVDPATNEQFRIHGVSGHFGGGLDGILRMPAAYQFQEPLLLEMKTSKTGPAFQKLVEQGVKIAKPQHFKQMSSYGRKYGFKYALYLCIDKNDDTIHVEIVELDWTLGADLEQRAADIIVSKLPPPRVNESPAYFLCKLCDRHDVCHKGAPYQRNCRSCDFAQPVENGQWFCGKWNNIIPEDFIPVGCDGWHPVGRAQ